MSTTAPADDVKLLAERAEGLAAEELVRGKGLGPLREQGDVVVRSGRRHAAHRTIGLGRTDKQG